MDPEFLKSSEATCAELAGQIEAQIEGVRVNNLGTQILLMFDNKSVATIYPLTADTVDIFAKDFRDRDFDLKDLSIAKALEFIRELATLQVEQSSTGAVAPVSQPVATNKRKVSDIRNRRSASWISTSFLTTSALPASSRRK